MNEPTPREFPSAPFIQICAATSCDVVTDRPWAQLFALDQHGKIWKYTNSGMIRIASLMLWLALAAPAAASSLAFDFSGVMAFGSAAGSFQYETTAAATLTNLGGMQNVVYTPTSWSFQMLSGIGGLGDRLYASGLAGQTGALCVGICTFGSGQQLRLDLRDGLGTRFYMSFGLTEPLTALPTSASQIGGFQEAIYRVEGSVPLVPFASGVLRQASSSVPEPATYLLLGIAGLVWLVLFWSEVKR